MLYGLVISTVAKEEIHAMQMSLGSFFPVLLLSGVIWPLEAIPSYLRWFSLALPTTWAADCMRSLMLRGWDASHSGVYGAYLVVFGWGLLMLVISIFSVKRIE